MKRLSVLSLVLVLALVTISGVLAADKPARTAIKAMGEITVDGSLSEETWLAASPVALFADDPVVKAFGMVWETAAASASVRLAWDEANFYMAAVVHDESIVTDADMFYRNDCVCPFFYSGEDDLKHKFFAVPADPPVVFSGLLGGGAVENKAVKAAAEKTGSGYVLEVAIPWSELAGFEPAAGKAVRFALLVIDAADASWGQYMDIGKGDDWSGFGVLEFAE